jgi:hypothetical protein
MDAILNPLPDLAWRGLAGMCGRTISPVYHSIQNVLYDDVEQLAQLMSDLETSSEEASSAKSTVSHPSCTDYAPEYQFSCLQIDEDALAFLPTPDLAPDLPPHNPPQIPTTSLKRHCPSLTLTQPLSIPSAPSQPLSIPSATPSTPAIIITPCGPAPHDFSCRAPLQDSSFGTRLTLPTHTSFNRAFPPQPYPLVPTPGMVHVDRWRYVRGHWHAVLPSLEEQRRRGAFSRAIVGKRKACQR